MMGTNSDSRRVVVWYLLGLLVLQSSTTALSSTSTFYILRHGETDANAAGIIQGSLDKSRLTERGRQQALTVGQTVLHGGGALPMIDAIYVSPLTRARDTLAIVRAQQLSDPTRRSLLPPTETIHPQLREIDFYSWEYQTQTSLLMRYPNEYKAWKRGDPDRLIVDGHQPLVELWSRAQSVWEELLLPQGKHETTLLVCHGTLGQALLATAFGLDATTFRSPEMVFTNCGLCEIVFDNSSSSRQKPPVARRWRWIHPNPTDYADLREQVHETVYDR